MTERRCLSCWKIQDRQELIRITTDYATGEVSINKNTKKFGRSAYVCKNKNCIEQAFKKNKLEKNLRVSIPQELKGQLLDELRNS